MTSIRDSFRLTVQRLSPTLGHEAVDAARIIFEDVAGYDRNYIFANGDREMLDFTQARVDSVVEKVLSGAPVQYAVGSARFMGMNFLVTPAVLIPRPETAGLVDMLVDCLAHRSDLDVLDICTGSGCIAIALARALAFARVEAVDVSVDALEVAKKNAFDLHARVRFRQTDALTMPKPCSPCYDVIISNPPYVCEEEKAMMDSRVLDYEPHLALFVSDDEPLSFYDAIASYATAALRPGGMLYFEINPRFATQLAAMLRTCGFENVGIYRDFRGAERFAVATKSIEV